MSKLIVKEIPKKWVLLIIHQKKKPTCREMCLGEFAVDMETATLTVQRGDSQRAGNHGPPNQKVLMNISAVIDNRVSYSTPAPFWGAGKGCKLPPSSGLPLSEEMELSQLLLKAEKISWRPWVCFSAVSLCLSHLLSAWVSQLLQLMHVP